MGFKLKTLKGHRQIFNIALLNLTILQAKCSMFAWAKGGSPNDLSELTCQPLEKN